jgi:predicted tellurium resistance membrane protein TerC
MDWIADPQAWIALATLTALEIVLGIDNIVFITLLVGRLPKEQRGSGRNLGLLLAMATRIILLLSLTWVMGLTAPLFEIFTRAISGRDLILLGGGLFLLGKSTHEIHNNLEGAEDGHGEPMAAGFVGVLAQVALIDIVFSLDSVITAVGLAQHLAIMIIAIVISVGVMLFAAQAVGDYVEAHPTIKILALSFLLLVGFTLMGEGLGLHIPKGYIYFAMAFSLGVEMLNLKVRARAAQPVKLHQRVL